MDTKKKIILKKKTKKTKNIISSIVLSENKIKSESYQDLIKQDYLDFIKNLIHNDIITKCHSKMILEKFNKKKYIYPQPSSNIQLSTFFNKVLKNRKKHFYINRFYILLTHFLSNKFSISLLNKIYKNPDMTDRQFINLIINSSKENKKPSLYNFNDEIDNINDIDFCSEKIFQLQNIFQHFKNFFIKIFNKPYTIKSLKNMNYRYLDIGCGNGKKTKLVEKIFNIPKNLVYGTDIKNWGPYQSHKFFDFTFKYILPDGKLDFPDNYFGFITCFFTLHHVPNLNLLLSEIKRVLIPNGLILITEHNVFNYYDGLLIDIQHMLYSYLYDSKLNPKNYKNYIKNPSYNRYFNYLEWDYIFNKHNFKYKHGNVMFNSIYGPTYDNQYYCIYQNIK